MEAIVCPSILINAFSLVIEIKIVLSLVLLTKSAGSVQKIFRSINSWSTLYRLHVFRSVRVLSFLTCFSSISDDGMLHIETGLDQCGTVVDQTEDGDIAFHNVISVTEYSSGLSSGPL